MRPLSEALADLRQSLADAPLSLDIDGVLEARTERSELIDQIDDYLLPRLAALDAPLLVVVGGSTGSGKSTITNTLVGSTVSAAGVLRPTTRAPVLVCHPDDTDWFMGRGVLGDLPRATGPEAATGAVLQVRPSAAVPAGMAILDSPDIDSVETANHTLATQLLGAADLWLFVTTAARYADAVPWEYLKRAGDRAIALALVVNRIPPGAEQEVTDHLAQMMDERGLSTMMLFPIAEGNVVDDQLTTGTDEVREWLHSLAADSDKRREMVRSTLAGAVASIPNRTARVTEGIAAQAASASALRKAAARRYEESLHAIDDELRSGKLLRGEVLDTWQEHVGTGEFMQRLQRGVGRIRDRVRAVVTGKPISPDSEMRDEVETSLAAVVRRAADSAALDVVSSWETLAGGAQLLDHGPRDLNRASAALNDRFTKELDQWHSSVLALIRREAGTKVAVARTLSFGINSIGVGLMVAVFSQTGGVTGGEAGVAAGTAAVSQAMLAAVFGEQAVRDLTALARDDLRLRLAGLLIEERSRFDGLVDSIATTTDASAVQSALAAVVQARDV